VPGWDPARYLAFADQRLRPALDLIARIPEIEPRAIWDLGCGTGSATRLLAQRWPAARITGVDSSAAMLARALEGSIAWVQADIIDWLARGQTADLVFSNAALHWLDDHEVLFPRLVRSLAPGGVLAVQMPRNHGEPSHTCMAEAARAGSWAAAVAPALRERPVLEPERYYDLVAPLAASVDLWETVYLHALEGDDPVVAWTRSTALAPLLEAAGPHATALLADYTARVRIAYPKRPDGRTLLPFRRTFLVVRRA
jgi:trans-aconitate 2-methyltransferase